MMVNEVYWTNHDVALENILKRKRERSKGLLGPKKVKSALVIQGGGMRGAFSAGSLIALENLGFAESFDAIYASSSGAINGSYFLAKQSALGTSIYYRDINNSKFINIFRPKKIFDVGR